MQLGDKVRMTEDTDQWNQGDTATLIDFEDDSIEEYPYQIEFGHGLKCWVRVEDVDFNICDD